MFEEGRKKELVIICSQQIKEDIERLAEHAYFGIKSYGFVVKFIIAEDGKEVKFNDVVALMNSKSITIQEVLDDESNESNRLFAKYGVSGVPSGILVGGDKIVRLGSNITPQSVRQALYNWR
jgi:hypothetical protein